MTTARLRSTIAVTALVASLVTASPAAASSPSAGAAPTASVNWTSAVAKPVITRQPVSQRVAVGKTMTLRVTVSSTAKVSYKWQQLVPGGRWTTIAGATTSTLLREAKVTRNGIQYRALVSNVGGQVVSAAAKLTVVTPRPVITAQPRSVNVQSGATAKFSVTALGANLRYQWQAQAPGKSWTSILGATATSYTVRANLAKRGTKYRVVIKNPIASVISSAASLTVAATRSDPNRVGTTTQLKHWKVQVTKVNYDDWPTAKKLGFGPGPRAGNRHVAVWVTVTRTSAEPESPYIDLDVAFVGTDNRTYTRTRNSVQYSFANDIYSIDDLYRNGRAAFVTALEVPASVTGGVWRITDDSDWGDVRTTWFR